MTIYMVQHTFSRPAWEDEWNAWYGGNLQVLSAPYRGMGIGQRELAESLGRTRELTLYQSATAQPGPLY